MTTIRNPTDPDEPELGFVRRNQIKRRAVVKLVRATASNEK